MLIISIEERLKQLLFLSIVIIALFHVSLTYGQEYEKHIYITNEGKLPYRILLPEGYEEGSQKKYPLVVFLHGIGERGNNNESQLVHCSDFF
jgi:predicted peptidase